MSFERSVLVATVILAAALAAVSARAQVPAPQAADCSGGKETSGEVVRVVDGRSFLLADGREVRLAAIEAPVLVPDDEDEARVAAAVAARKALEAFVLHAEISLRVLGISPDRYGRLIAYAFIRTPSGETLVQRELLAAGHALVSPGPVAARCRTYLRNTERDARTGRLGLWGDPYYVVKRAANPLDVLAEQGRFALVEGLVTSVRESGGMIYVNFGRRWPEHFTVTVLKRNQGIFASAGLIPTALAGRRIEVRGWIEERGGPAIEAMRPEQIEIVN